MDAFLQAAALVFTPTSLIYMFLGVFFGILCGAINCTLQNGHS